MVGFAIRLHRRPPGDLRLMRFYVVMVLFGLLSACASEPLDTIACTDPRPQVCTMEFAPACAVLASGVRKEFASPCSACADPAVTGYVSGPCPE